MQKILGLSIAALLGFASTVHAATLVALSGQVLVNRGTGFELAQPGLELKPGDMVVANPGATAQIMYPQGCLVPVVPGQIATVVETPKCPPLTTGVLPAAAAVAAAGAGAGAAGVSTAALVGGSAAIAGGGAAAYALSKNNTSSSPASP